MAVTDILLDQVEVGVPHQSRYVDIALMILGAAITSGTFLSRRDQAERYLKYLSSNARTIWFEGRSKLHVHS